MLLQHVMDNGITLEYAVDIPMMVSTVEPLVVICNTAKLQLGESQFLRFMCLKVIQAAPSIGIPVEAVSRMKRGCFERVNKEYLKSTSGC